MHFFNEYLHNTVIFLFMLNRGNKGIVHISDYCSKKIKSTEIQLDPGAHLITS